MKRLLTANGFTLMLLFVMIIITSIQNQNIERAIYVIGLCVLVELYFINEKLDEKL